MFNELPLSGLHQPRTRTRWTFLLSLGGELLVLGVLLLVPLIYVQTLPSGLRQITLLPPIPAATPPPAITVATPVRTSGVATLSFPISSAPHAVSIGTRPAVYASPGDISIPEAPEVPGSSRGTSPTSIVPNPGPAAPAAPRQPTGPYAVSTGVAEGKLLQMVRPQYPDYAREAGIQGTVMLQAIISPNGKVVSVKYVSGPPILAPAAEEAVRQWLYRPTLLNGQPVSIETIIKVIFKLGDSGGSQPPSPPQNPASARRIQPG